MLSRRVFTGAVFGTAFGSTFAAAPAAFADTWPTRAIHVISPFFPGSAADTVARVVSDQVSQKLGQVMLIEPRPGAGGTVGFADCAKSTPDGYTAVVSSSSMASEMVLHSKLPYDPIKDFTPVVLFGEQPNVLVVWNGSGIKTVADLVAAAKAKPGDLTFASAGVGSASHMAGERFRLATGIDVKHVPFRESGLTEVMAGRIDFYAIPLAAAASALASGKLNILAVTTAKREPSLPDVPSIAEAGYPAAEYRFWNGLSVPAQTPRPVVDKLHDTTQEVLQDPTIVARLAKLGVTPVSMSVEEFGKYVRDDLAATLQLAKEAHIEPTD